MRDSKIFWKSVLTILICLALFFTYNYLDKKLSEYYIKSSDLIKEELFAYNNFYTEFQSREYISEEDYAMFVSELNKMILIDFSNDMNSTSLKAKVIEFGLMVLFAIIGFMFLLELIIVYVNQLFIKPKYTPSEQVIMQNNYNYDKAVEFFNDFKNKH